MSDCNSIDTILERSGTGQYQRFVKSLNPENFELQDFNTEDWLLFAFNFAQYVNYYDTSNAELIKGNWQDFFKHFSPNHTTIPFRSENEYKRLLTSITETLEEHQKEGDLTPHLTLFVCFLKLIELSKKRFNKLTKRHLDFYYKEVLQLDKRAAKPDQIHAIFEIAKRSIEEKVESETALNAKKDKLGNPLVYTTDEELIVNKTQVTTLKSVFNDINKGEIVAANDVKTLDGLEEPLLEESPYWWPFGHISGESNFTDLPNANIGFAIASPMLRLAEGTRNVQLTITFENQNKDDEKIDLIDFNDLSKYPKLADIITVQASGAENWIEDILLKDKAGDYETKIVNNNTLQLAFQVEKGVESIVAYNEEFLLEQFHTKEPIVKFSIDTKDGHALYRALVKRHVVSIKIDVHVIGATSVSLESDNGVLKTRKPFYPFTTQPIKDGKFFIDYPELFQKNWQSIGVSFDWKNTPDDFSSWYEAYLKGFTGNFTAKSYQTELKKAKALRQAIVDNKEYFTTAIDLWSNEQWKPISTNNALFKDFEKVEGVQREGHQFRLNITENKGYTIDKSGPIRLSLDHSFLHEVFPKIYAIAMTGADAIDDLIPNTPYTPIGENISLDYIASETRTISKQSLPKKGETLVLETTNTKEAYDANRIQLFHDHPFGECEEHAYLKATSQVKGIKDSTDGESVETLLVPKYCHGGQLYIGLENAEVLQTVSLLIQVLEGSENPEKPSFETREDISWAVLCDNQWKDLKDYIVSNSTNKLLSSGIIKISIPREATKNNSRLPSGYIWLKAQIHRDYDVVCKAIDIHAQAVTATFQDNTNELSHLENGLPADTIKKLITRTPQIKGVEQPYTGFGGGAEESDLDFYRRISERLRHKNRAVTLWDYEHLILQEFPEIFKAKCLNHTKNEKFNKAGEVTIVVIPDTVNKNVFDIYKPRVSMGTINNVKNYINQLNTKLVEADIINPNYEEVKVALDVTFHDGYDNSFYSKQLEEDITKFLSPWAFDDAKEIVFGIELHPSVLIDYMEKLVYVDYLENVKIYKKDKLVEGSVKPSDPTAILVSAKEHTIRIATLECGKKTDDTTITCQV